jgi:DNA-binding response OmpR family regulator
MTYRIVFVEDDADLAELISDFLARHEMDVVIEPRGDTALATIAREAPDMVLLDIMLPGKDGLSICRELRPNFDGPIIMLTSLDSDMNQILGLELGANDYILKTTPPSVLVAACAHNCAICARRSRQRGRTGQNPAQADIRPAVDRPGQPRCDSGQGKSGPFHLRLRPAVAAGQSCRRNPQPRHPAQGNARCQL